MAKRYGSEKVNGPLLRTLMRQRGLFPDEMADQAHMSLRVVQKMMASDRCQLDFIKRIAGVLKVDSNLLIESNVLNGTVNPSPFLQGTIQFSGYLERFSPAVLLKISQEIAALLATYGISVTAYQSQMALQEIADQAARVIVLTYGRLDDQRPFWCYVAVKPSKHKEFVAAQQAGKLNLREFAEFGEVIISGLDIDGLQKATVAVAKDFGCDPSSFFKDTDIDAEVMKRIERHVSNGARQDQEFLKAREECPNPAEDANQ